MLLQSDQCEIEMTKTKLIIRAFLPDGNRAEWSAPLVPKVRMAMALELTEDLPRYMHTLECTIDSMQTRIEEYEMPIVRVEEEPENIIPFRRPQ